MIGGHDHVFGLSLQLPLDFLNRTPDLGDRRGVVHTILNTHLLWMQYANNSERRNEDGNEDEVIGQSESEVAGPARPANLPFHALKVTSASDWAIRFRWFLA